MGWSVNRTERTLIGFNPSLLPLGVILATCVDLNKQLLVNLSMNLLLLLLDQVPVSTSTFEGSQLYYIIGTPITEVL